MRSSGLLRSELWLFLTDVSGQPIGIIDVTQRVVTIPYRRFGTTYRSHRSYTASSDNSLPSFRQNLLVPSKLHSE